MQCCSSARSSAARLPAQARPSDAHAAAQARLQATPLSEELAALTAELGGMRLLALQRRAVGAGVRPCGEVCMFLC